MFKYFIIGLIFFSSQVLAIPAKVTDFRVSQKKNQSRFVFETTKPVHFKHFFLSHPNRLVVDLNNTKSKINLTRKRSSFTITPVKDIRDFHHKKGYLRIVFDLKYKTHVKLFTLKNPDRLVVDFTSKELAPVMTLKKRKKLRNIVVVIDPGHGGKDPGATGPAGHHEKNIVLAISKDLYRMINKEPGFTAKLTRRGDYYITLWGRLKIARRDHADMFIAIHADAFKNHHARGASVYALSERGATSTAAKWLAERENRSELIGGVQLGDKDRMLRSVLISLSQNHTIAVSLQMGSSILRQLSRLTLLHNDRVDQAAFVVLKSPDIPSLLVETGFITNPREERRLVSKKYQRRLAYALTLGIKDYFMRHPPVGTYLAYKENGK